MTTSKNLDLILYILDREWYYNNVNQTNRTTKEATNMKFRVFDTYTDETITIITAKDIMEASYIAGKIFGPDSEDTDIEAMEN